MYKPYFSALYLGPSCALTEVCKVSLLMVLLMTLIRLKNGVAAIIGEREGDAAQISRSHKGKEEGGH